MSVGPELKSPIWVRSATRTGVAATGSDEFSITVIDSTAHPDKVSSDNLLFGSVSPQCRQWWLQSLQVRVNDVSNGATFAQAADILFYHSNAFESDTIASDAFIGWLEIPAATAFPVSGTAGVRQWSDHDINMCLLDTGTRSGTTQPPQIHIQIQWGAGDLAAGDSYQIQMCLIEV